ncbi:hemin uptake protein HemP [Falsiroseomonas tokyonensis]|uniref:Hemin uptake protein HemP n=1 Tax=Falsiroseomonas tokyonensis TaxID=430521 RepID=A0ABV7BSI3_9PROT|nr:hemin uptake protein HemP [Falsiroseomonas tokyonensis]MBU8537631.1 hemin uptake protein HemP [Falsiroseomonas tokyonensis]
MTQPALVTRDTPAPAMVPSTELLRGARELLIEHHGEIYRLRLTSNDKLILTK